MKRTSFIKGMVLLMGISVMVACDHKDDPSPNPKAMTVSKTTINKGGTVTFTDNSEGVKSRVWTFPGGTPETSTESSVTVTFAAEGPATCALQDNFYDGSSKSQEKVIQVGTELMARYNAGFEGDTCLHVWSYWCPSKVDSAAYELSIDKTQGADGTSRCLKIVVKSPGHEIQIYSVPKSGIVNDFSLSIDPVVAYTLSYWTKSSDFIGYIDSNQNDGSFNHDVVNKSADDPVQTNRQNWGDYAWGNMTLTTSWAKISQDFGPKDLYNGALTKNTYVFFKLFPSKTGTLYIDEVSVKPKE